MARRLHPAGIAVLAASALREAAFPVVLGLAAIAGGGGLDLGSLLRALAFAALAAGVAGASGYVTWRTVEYAVTERAIIARRGVFATRETVVPLERVQALDTVQGPLQRLFGVTAVHVQAAGGGKEGEIVLEALSPAAVGELRERVGRVGHADPAAPPAPGAVRRLGRGRLAAAAATSGQLGVILPVLAAGSQLIDDLVRDDADADALFGALPDTPAEVALALAALLLVAWLLSIAGAIVAFSGFTVIREGERLRIRRGVLARREASVPLARVQAVTVVEGVLRQPFGLASVRVEVAGYAAEASAAQTLFPLLRIGEVEGFLAEMVPAFATAPATGLTRPPRRALRRYVAPPLLVLGAVPAAGLAVAGLAPLAPVALALGALAGVLAHRAEGIRIADGLVVVRGRRVARRTVIASRRRLQRHQTGQSPFQRRAGLASLGLAAGSSTRAGVRHLEERDARQLFAAL